MTPAQRLAALVARGDTPILVRSPPGAGKTELVAATAAAAAGQHGERVCVVTTTNNQAADAATRTAARRPGVPVVLALGQKADIPAQAGPEIAAGRLTVVRPFDTFPQGPGVVLASAAKWNCHPGTDAPPYDLQILEECFQLPWHAAWPIADLARRHAAVGDPGQVRPFSVADDGRWLGQPTSPIAPTGDVLRRLNPDRPAIDLDTSHRLPDDTCALLQPALYPHLPFRGAAAAGERRFVPAPTAATTDAAGRAVARLATASLVAWPLPALPNGAPLDPELCAAAAAAATAACAGQVVEDGLARPVDARRVAIVCARTQQVAAVRAALTGPARYQIHVDTANRLQGMTFDLVVAVCPLVGHHALGPFELEAGRLCVMLSRHRVGCLLVTREHVQALLSRHVPGSDRAVGSDDDPEFRGWQANLRLRTALANAAR